MTDLANGLVHSRSGLTYQTGLLLTPLTSGDLATLTDLLTRIRDQMRTAPPRSAPRPGRKD